MHADPLAALLETLGGEERREILGHTAEDALILLVTGLALLALDALPLFQEIIVDRGAREDMWVTPDELLIETACDIVDIEGAVLVRELRVQRDLQQQVAELIAQRLAVAGVERLEGLVRLFEQERPQGRVGLLLVPRTPVRRAQAFGDACDGRE